MRSLRGRLVAILLFISLAGLLVLAAVTFAAQRSYLYDRVDRQISSSFGVVGGQLVFAQRSGANNCTGRVPSERLGESALGGAPPSAPPGLSLPPGTYGAIVSPDRSVLAECVFGFLGAENYPLPHFEDIALSQQPRTVHARGGDSTEFRAASRILQSGDHVVVAVPLSEAEQTISRLVAVEAVVIAIVLAVLGIAAWLLVGVGLRPLDEMGETADAIAGGDLDRRVEPTDSRSEIGRLGLALNRMLHRLEQAFNERQASESRLRQFLADASHELRTPLVSIRGYAELYRLGAAKDPADVDRSMERIEQEAERMGLLVEDMLTLARLDETHEADHRELDLGELVHDAVRDAEVADPARSFSAEVASDLFVIGDGHQLQQVLVNLLRNASVHTAPGTPVEITASARSGEVLVEVRDHGDGLPPDATDQLFARFWRAEGGRERGKAGSGLGLSIVAEIVAAHGGRVSAANSDQGGAVFSVWLPLAPTRQ